MTFIGHPDQHFGCTTYSQHGEDLVILNIFKLLEIKKPTYLDLGAHHPEVISNTKLLYDQGSRGINVEANPYLLRAFQDERHGDINLNLAVTADSEQRSVTLHMFDDTSGRNTCDVHEAAAVQRNEKRPVKKLLDVPAKTINGIVRSFWSRASYPDLLTMDLEGWDFAVLASADFTSQAGPKVICVETRKDDTGHMVELMTVKGLGYRCLCRMGENLIFVRNDFYNRLYWGL